MNLDEDNNFYGDDPDNIIHLRLLAWRKEFEKRKPLKEKIRKELMPEAKHPKKWWDWCLSENEEREIDPVLTDKVGKC